MLTGRGAPTKILICGHSIVFWAAKRAKTSSWGSRLSLGPTVHIDWLGRRGMRWSQLLPVLSEYLGNNQPPDVLIIHLGENDLCHTKGVALFVAACKDLDTVRGWLPDCVLAWSELLQRRVWAGARFPPKIEKKRKEVSTRVGTFVRSLGGVVIPHPAIRFDCHTLYRGDGVHLSTEGADLFLNDLRCGVRDLLPLVVGREGQAEADPPRCGRESGVNRSENGGVNVQTGQLRQRGVALVGLSPARDGRPGGSAPCRRGIHLNPTRGGVGSSPSVALGSLMLSRLHRNPASQVSLGWPLRTNHPFPVFP